MIRKVFSSKVILMFFILLILSMSLAGCKGANTQSADSKSKEINGVFKVTITDDMGRTVSLQKEPKRIVSLAPSNTEIMFFLGLGNRVVADTTYCDYPEEAKHCTKVGGFNDPSLEKIVMLKPDLVLATDIHKEMIKGLEEAGLNVIVLNSDTIAGIFDDIRLVGRVMGIEDKAIDMTKDLQDRVNAVTQKVLEVPEDQKPYVYYEMWYEPLMSVGRDNRIGQMIRMAGGVNITDDCIEEYPQISEEVIIEKNPDVMINSYGHGSNKVITSGIAARKGWSQISFVKNHKIYTIDADLLELPGPRIVEGLEKMAEVFHPELFNSTKGMTEN